MPPSNNSFQLPAPIATKLRSVQRRMTGVGFVTAMVAAVAVLLSAMAVAMLVDYLATLYDSAWRPALTLSAMVTALATLTGWCIYAWRKTSRVEHVAREIDRSVPYLEERWSTVAGFAAQAERSPEEASVVHPAMFRHVADEALRGDQHVDANYVVSLSGVVKAFLALNAVTVVLVLAAIADWQSTTTLFHRFWAPSANISATRIEAQPGSTVVARGEPLVLTAAFEGKPIDQATLMLRLPSEEDPADTSDEQILLVPHGEETLSVSHRIRKVEDSFAYRVRGGDGQTDWHDVTVSDRPVIAQVSIDLVPPAYRNEKAKHLNKLPRRISAVSGTEFSLAIKPKAEVASLSLELGSGKSVDLQPDGDGWYHWNQTLSEHLKLTPQLTEPQGLTLRRPPTTQLHVYPDSKPVVKILSPDDEIAVAPDDTIQIDYVAEDDNGIGAAELVVFQEPAEEGGEPIELSRTPLPLGDDRGEKKVRGTTELNLAEYALEDGAGISYAIRVVEQRWEDIQPTESSQVTEQVASAGGDKSNEGSPDIQQDGSVSNRDDAMARDSRNNDSEYRDSEYRDSIADATPKQEAKQGQSSATQQPPQSPATASDALAKRETNESERSATVRNNEADISSQEKQPTSDQTAARDEKQSLSDSQPVATSTSAPATSPTKLTAKADATEESATNSEADKSDLSPKSDELAQANGTEEPNGSSEAASEENQSSGSGTKPGEPNEKQLAADMPAEEKPSPADNNASNPASEKATASKPAEADNPNNGPGNRSATSRSRSLVAGSTKPASDEPAEPAEPAEKTEKESSNMDENQVASAMKPESKSPQSGTPQDSQMASQRSNDSKRGNNSQQQPSNPSNQANENQQANSSSNRAADNMTKRMLDVGGQASSSNQMRIKVDKYAGSFEGQQREKLEIAIAPSLEAIKKHLVRAQKLTRATLDDLQAGQGWQARHHRDVTASESTLRKAQEVARELQGKTHNTPYALLGLQVADISAANLTPARDYLWKSLRSEGEQRTDEVRMGWQQVGQALSRLESTSNKYESTRREFALADATQKIEKMYRVFVEDSLLRPFSEGGGDTGSNLSRKVAEFDLDEEYLARLKEVLEMRRDLLAELSKILAEDPRLLRRFMNNFRNQADNLRNQLSALHDRQDRLTGEMEIWADESKREAALPLLAGLRLDEAASIADDLSTLADQFDAWMPLDADRTKGPLPETLDQINRITADARELAANATAAGKSDTPLGPDSPLMEQGLKVYEGLRQLEVRLRSLGSEKSLEDQTNLLINRMAETKKLITKTSSWNRRLKELSTGKLERVAAIEQYELATETDALAAKLADVEQTLAGLLQTEDGTLPPTIAAKSQELLEALDRRVTPNQLAAAIALEREAWPRLAQRQQAAGKGLTEAERLFDEMLKLAIAELDDMPVQDPIAQLLQEPTLDDILRELENQLELPENLGIPRRRNNIQVIDDWLRPGSGGSGGNSGRMIARQMQSDEMRMRRAAREARREALRRIKEGRKVQVMAPKRSKKPKVDSTDWNVLVSKLDDDLLQGRDKLPPEKYRAAIEQYYSLINDAASENSNSGEEDN